MRHILILSFLIMSNLIYGQLFLSNPDYYVFNNSKDTLYLTKIEIDIRTNEIFPTKSSKIFDTIQVDGIGSKEIIFERSYSGKYSSIMQAHQEEVFIKIHKYEIWNIDTKTLLFEAISSYEYRYENWQLVTNHSSYAYDFSIDSTGRISATKTIDGWSRGLCSYAYDFSIDSTGRIKTSATKTISTGARCTPDKEEGIYTFTNGQYKKE